MRFFCTNSNAQLPDECPGLAEVGRNMSSDKLTVAARAAGFAMAYDEAPVGAGAKAPSPLHPQIPAIREEPRVQSTDLIVGKISGSNSTWGFGGWTFWKTA